MKFINKIASAFRIFINYIRYLILENVIVNINFIRCLFGKYFYLANIIKKFEVYILITSIQLTLSYKFFNIIKF